VERKFEDKNNGRYLEQEKHKTYHENESQLNMLHRLQELLRQGDNDLLRMAVEEEITKIAFPNETSEQDQHNMHQQKKNQLPPLLEFSSESDHREKMRGKVKRSFEQKKIKIYTHHMCRPM